MVTIKDYGFIRRLSEEKNFIALDTETTGLDEKDQPFGLSLAGSDVSYYLDDRLWPEMWTDVALKEFLEHPRLSWVLQNPKFDMRMLASKGITLRGKIYDLTVMARLVRNDHLVYGLDAQAKRYGMGKDDRVKAYIKANKCEELRKDGLGREYKSLRFDQVPLDLIAEYAKIDAEVTYRLANIYLGKLSESELSVLDNECALTPVCFDMERRGVLLDPTYTIQAMHYEKGLAEKARAEYLEVTGSKFVNSAKSVAPHLDYRLPETDKGNPSLDDDVLEEVILKGTEKDRVVADTVRRIRRLEKRVSTYYEDYLARINPDWRIRPSMWPGGTRTGRFSYSNPNLQNIPKEEESVDPFVVRGCFVPREGHIFVSMDYSQMEYRMMAAYANEKEVIRQVMNGADFHEATAKMFGVSRKQAKTLNFAILYGAGEAKLASMLGLTTEQARILKFKYFQALPLVERLIDGVIKKGKQQGYVTNWFGRRLYAEHEHCYALPNHLIQSGGSEVVKRAMVAIAKDLPLYMILQVHDQLVFEVPRGTDLNLIKRAKEIMESSWIDKNSMRLTIDVSHSEKSLAERDFVKGLPKWT